MNSASENSLLHAIKNWLGANRKLLIVSIVHFAISVLFSLSSFHPIMDHTGYENVAYQWLSTGSSMEYDTISKVLCVLYSFLLALLIVYCIWKGIFRLWSLWKNKEINRFYLIIYFALVLAGLFTILALYPKTLVAPPDTAYNYVYAKAWMPMYWHGFLTNVIHCASMIVFSHPVAMSIIPYVLGISAVCHIIYKAVVQRYRLGIIAGAVFAILIWWLPETIQVFLYAGRNYIYALLSVSTLTLFLLDKMDNKPLTWKRFLVLTFLICFLACWRGEGIGYLAAFPFLLYSTYYQKGILKKHKRDIVKGFILALAVFSFLSIPDRYGRKKYQGYDYYIINLPGPLSAVWANNPNEEYEGYEEDLRRIEAVIPREYIVKYGDEGSINYNWEHLRTTRQSDAGENGKRFVIASYRFLLHNYKTFIKYQINISARSHGLKPFFDLNPVNKEPFEMSDDVKLWRDRLLAYYKIGQDDIVNQHDIVLINNETDEIITSEFNEFAFNHYDQLKNSATLKIALIIITIIIVVAALIRRRWLYFWMGSLILALLVLIILLAPSVRQNYYNTPVYNMCFFIFCYCIQLKIDYDRKRRTYNLYRNSGVE